MIQRSRGILIYHDKVLVIKIEKKSGEFHTFPGGHGKKREQLEDTCVREFLEETGLKVKIIKSIYKTNEKDHKTIYYLCELDNESDVQMDENKYPVARVIGEELERKGRYEAKWLSISELKTVNLYPSEILGKLESLIH